MIPSRASSRLMAILIPAGLATIPACQSGQGGKPAGPAAVARVVVTPSVQTIASGGTATLTASVQDASGNPLSRSVSWSTDNPAVATVSSSGVVTGAMVAAATPATAVVVATSEGKTGSATLTVLPAAVDRVVVTPAVHTIASGGTVTLTASVQDASGNPLSRSVSWSTDNPAVATVSSSGIVTGAMVTSATPATAVVVATSEGTTGSATLTVLPVAVARVVVTPDSAELLAGHSRTLTVALQGPDGSPLTGRPVVWSTTDAAIATVSNEGVVTTGQYLGELVRTVRIIARSDAAIDTAVIRVNPVPLATISVTPGGGTLVESDTLQLAATAKDSLGRTLTGRVMAWSTSDVAIADVSTTGRVIATPYAGDVMSRPVTISASSAGKTTPVLLSVTVDLNRASTYYQAVPNGMPNLGGYFPGMGGSAAMYAPLVVDLNKDGREDLVLHFWHFRTLAERRGLDLNAPVANRLIALVANPDGTYADRTQQLFGTATVDLAGGTSRSVRTADLNGDGYPDWVYALNREDGRPHPDNACPSWHTLASEGHHCWTNQAAAVLSNGDGTYRAVPFGYRKYHHLVGLFRAMDGKWHVTFNSNDFNDPGNYRYDGGNSFTPVAGYPHHGIGTMLGFSSTGGLGADRFLTDNFWNDIPPAVILYGGQPGSYTEQARFQWTTARQIDFTEDGNTHRDWVVYHNGNEYLTGGWWESCTLRMSPGAPTTLITAYHTSKLIGGTQGRTAINASEPRQPWHKLFALQQNGNQLVDIGVLPASAEGPYSTYFITCADMNGDGFTDIAAHATGLGVQPRLFLNQQGGSFSKVPDARFPAAPPYNGFSFLLADSNGDGIKDLIYYPEACNGGVHCAVFGLYRGRRQIR